MVMERPSTCLDVFDLVSTYGKLDEQTARGIFLQVVDTVCNMYSKHGLIHRDIKVHLQFCSWFLFFWPGILSSCFSCPQLCPCSCPISCPCVFHVLSLFVLLLPLCPSFVFVIVLSPVEPTQHDDHQQDENIIVDMETGEVKLVDFGATALADKAMKKEFQGDYL